jgi:uncharacterized protein YlxW (UPF0749 family)
LILIISGFILARHFILVRAELDNTVNIAEIQKAQQELTELENERDKIELEYQIMRKELSDLWHEVIADDETQEVDILNSLEDTRKKAGLTDVKGHGLVLTINDKEGYDPYEDPIESLIHDQNIIYLIDLLADNGAQAISVNDLRVVNSSKIFCIGTTILCNKQRMSPPYIIKVIGPQEQMKIALDADPVYSKLQEAPYLVRFSYQMIPDLIIKAYETPGTIEKDIEFLNPVTESIN